MERYTFFRFIVIAVGIYRDAVAEKPTIIPEMDELEIREGTQLKIDCYSKGSSVHFSFPNSTFMSPRSRYNITTVENGTSTFLRQNTVSLDTGWYACAAEGVEIENHFKILNHTHEDIAWIYVYVNSSEPFADRYYTFPKSIIVLNGSSAIVPCRPTSPSLNIQLWQNSRIVQLNDKDQFCPKIGFIIHQVVFETLVIHFQCKINAVVDRYDLYYSQAKCGKPKINSSSEEMSLREGDELRIECYGGIRRRFLFPNKIPQTSEHEIIDGDNGTSTFLRRKTVSDDTGWYGCAEGGINMKISFVNYMEYTRTEIEWIYVYVDPGFFRFIRDSFFPEYSDESDVYFPCRMTPLESDHIRELETESVELNKNVRFDSKFGFLVKEGLNDSVTGYYEWKIGTPTDNKTYFFHKPSKKIVKILTSPIRSIFFTGEDLHLPCVANIHSKKNNTLQWYSPSTTSENCIDYKTSKYLVNDKLDSYYVINILSKQTLKKSDSGEYSCSFDGIIKKKIVVSVFGPNDTDYIKLNLTKNHSELVRWQNENTKWIVDLQEFLVEGVVWTRPSNKTIEHAVSLDSNRREFHFTDGFWDLMEIHNLTLNDSGVYRIQINTSVGMISFNFTLVVQALPYIYIENETPPYYATHGKVFHAYCCTTRSPKPEIRWEFSKRPYFPYENDSELTAYYMHAFDSSNGKFVCSNLKMTTNMSGILTCTVCNSISCVASSTKILFSDNVRRFGIIVSDGRLFYGDDITLICSGSIYDFQNLSWNKNFDECYNTENLSKIYENHKMRFTENALLHLANVTSCHSRLYSCSGQTLSGTIETLSYSLNLFAPQKPYFTNTNLNKSRIIWSPDLEDRTILLICCAKGDPRPEVTWFENGRRLQESPEYRIFPTTCELLTTLDFRYSKNLRYMCSAENRFGEIKDYIDFQSEDNIQTARNDQRQLDKSLLFPNIFFVILLVGLIIAWFIQRKYRIKRSRQKFKRAILERFNEGAWNYVQPYIRIADQAEVLPYDVKWEYPRNLLKLDKILGSGAFGIVRKAEARSICPGKAVSTVAVKMVRAIHRLHYMTALIRELKVLVHLGGHLNIVNLLGACTQNVSYGELLVIVEFCRFGNLHDYLFRGRDNFIDELDSETGEIIGPNLEMDCIDIEHNSCCSTDFVDNNVNTNDEALKNGLVQPGLRCHYRGDEPGLIVESICTKDLLCWAWQVTRGMRYLGSRKVVHGDLAARNILLADNNVIKICDFGLAEILYKDDDYKKLGDDPLPLQWMAIESIKDRVFSTQSDIWSFGIVLWEFFTLAETPYRGTSPRNLYQKLSTGYRMSRPKYAPENIYRIMMKCWEAEPAERPSFLKLETDIALLLDDGIRTYYMDMDPPYTELTNETVETEKIDFLTMDPSEITAVSFSSGQEKVKLRDVRFDRLSCPSYPDSSSQDICSLLVSTEN